MDAVKRISELLADESPRKRIAAAVVLGELGVKDAAVVARLVEMASDPLDAYALPAVEALGQLRAMKALPALLAALDRKREVAERAREAIANLGEEALPALRARYDQATPEVRAVLSQLLPAVGGRASFELALEGMRDQPWDAVNKVALSVRQEARTMSDADKRVMRTQVEKFLAKKKTGDDEVALRGALKVLGFLELPDTQDTLLAHLGALQSTSVRVEASTALRFALAKGPSKKAVRRLMDLLTDADADVARAARDSLTVLKIGVNLVDELAELCLSPDAEVAVWAIRHLGGLASSEKGSAAKLAAKTLLPVARGGDRARCEAAVAVLAGLADGPSLLAEALMGAGDEVGAQVLSDVLTPLAGKLDKKQLKALAEVGGKNLTKSLAVGKRQLEPVRAADAASWAEILRDKAKRLAKADPPRAEAIALLLGKSAAATPEDRFGMAVQQLLHHSLDPHPRARQRDPALAELEKLHTEGFDLASAVGKEKKLSDEARYYVGVHFAEKPQFELKNVGGNVLEALAGAGKGKLAKAAKNKLKLLEL